MSAFDCIANCISLNGSVSISKFMEIALYHEKYGYYINRVPIYSDFITAPEISQLFGEVIAVWIIQTWEKLNKPRDFILVEAGAGLGTMMFDIISVIQKFTDLYSILKIYIIEISPILQYKQEQKLTKYLNKITWIKSIIDLPKKTIIFIANELFDAFPINQYVFKHSCWHEIKITFTSKHVNVKNCFSKLSYYEVPINDLDFLCVKDQITEGSVIEYSSVAINFLSMINQLLENYRGAALIIDYGYLKKPYYSTLQSVKENKYNDVLDNVGESDITSFVDFSNFKNFDIFTQKDFLFDFGIRERTNILININKNSSKKLINQFDRLTKQMGELFKVAIRIVT